MANGENYKKTWENHGKMGISPGNMGIFLGIYS